MQLPFSKHANARELYNFEVWARTTSARKHTKSLPRGVFGAERYFQVTTRPGLANVRSTRIFIPKLDNHKPYQEVLSVAYIERNYKQVASFTSSRCHHNKYIEVSLYEKQVTPPNRKFLTPKRRTKPLPSTDTEDRFIWPPSPTWEEKLRPSLLGAEKNDDNLWLADSLDSRPCGKETSLSSIIAEKKDEHQLQWKAPAWSNHDAEDCSTFPVFKWPDDDLSNPKRPTSLDWKVKAEPSSSVVEKDNDLLPLKSPASRSPVKESDPLLIFAREKNEHWGQWKARTSSNCENEAAPSSAVVEKEADDQWCFKRPTSPVWDMKAIPSSTIAEKEDDTWRLKPPASHLRGKKTSPPSVITEKEDAGQARSEISTKIPPGIIETAIKQLKLSEAQAKLSSVLADAAMAGDAVAGATRANDTGSDSPAEDTAGFEDIFYMPSEQPLHPTISETEGFYYLDEKDFGCYYPGRVSQPYSDYNDDRWEKVTACKKCGDPGNYPW
ncbi:uncharacterized protein N7446_009195 [Penicillium canescens]|uniref:Uncharacterized protein n=1 Tax=Penicillium canescens TaxID=5083 RepID=A0AAD6I628_PENCN|nr:uncharacterized protein N7446_009195 [Penicillium canescens]KAJ6034444.1 hypothetical protein N7460_008619 [Penicillium canescens]KAJ6046105.1 hypothetical protein N7444_007359 [Penicillium canescens]KAJ6053183.1 hypothetical protein N7446_009195 [Penicillium canescens]